MGDNATAADPSSIDAGLAMLDDESTPDTAETGNEGTDENVGEGDTDVGNTNENEAKDDQSEGQDGDDKADDDGEKEDKDDSDGDDKEGAPEEYKDFTLPDGMNMNEARLGDFKEVAKEVNLSQEQAQKMLDIGADLVNDVMQSHVEAFKEQQTTWVGQMKSDAEIGGSKFDSSVELALRARDKFGTPELKKALEDTGVGNHPEMVRFFSRVGKALGEDVAVKGGDTDNSSDLSPEELFYGKNDN